MYCFKNWFDTHRLMLFSCLMFLLGGAVRLLAGVSWEQAVLPALVCIVGSIAVWQYHSPLKRLRLRIFPLLIPIILFVFWFFDWKNPFFWLPGLLSPLVITALFFPKKRDLYTKLLLLSLFFGVVLCGNTALFFLAALAGFVCLYYEPIIRKLPFCGRNTALFGYLLLSLILFRLFTPDLKDAFLLWRTLLLSPEINAEGSGFWNLQVRQALLSTPFIGSHTPHTAIRSHMPVVFAICSHGLWLLLLIVFACGLFWLSAIQTLHNHCFHMQRWFGHAVILIQLFRCMTGLAGVLGWRFCITYGIPFFGCNLRDWFLDTVLTGLLLAASIRTLSLFPPEVPVFKVRSSHPLRKQKQ